MKITNDVNQIYCSLNEKAAKQEQKQRYDKMLCIATPVTKE